MEYTPHKNSPEDKRSPRSTSSRPSTRGSSAFTRKPALSAVKRPYSARGDKPAYEPRKSFGARTESTRTPSTRAPRTDSSTKAHYVRTPRVEAGSERKTYSPRAPERPSFGTRARSDAKPRYEQKMTERGERGARPSYGERSERPSFGARKEYAAKPVFEKTRFIRIQGGRLKHSSSS